MSSVMIREIKGKCKNLSNFQKFCYECIFKSSNTSVLENCFANLSFLKTRETSIIKLLPNRFEGKRCIRLISQEKTLDVHYSVLFKLSEAACAFSFNFPNGLCP